MNCSQHEGYPANILVRSCPSTSNVFCNVRVERFKQLNELSFGCHESHNVGGRLPNRRRFLCYHHCLNRNIKLLAKNGTRSWRQGKIQFVQSLRLAAHTSIRLNEFSTVHVLSSTGS